MEEELEGLMKTLKDQLLNQQGEIDEKALEQLVSSLTGLLSPQAKEKLFGFWVDMAGRLGDEKLANRLLEMISRLKK